MTLRQSLQETKDNFEQTIVSRSESRDEELLSVKEQLNAMINEKENVSCALQTLEEKHSVTEEQLAATSQKLAATSQELAATSQELASVTAQHSELMQSHEAFSEERSLLEQKLADSQREHEQLSSDHSAATATLSELELKLATLTDENARLKNGNVETDSQLTSELEELRHKLQKAEEDTAAFSKQLEVGIRALRAFSCRVFSYEF